MELEREDEFIEFVESNETATEKDGSSSIEPNRQADHRPEFCQYRDEGCELAGSCLNCPFIECIYDEPGGKQLWMRKVRDKEIVRLHINEGKKVKELAEMFGICQRTVQRVLKAAQRYQ